MISSHVTPVIYLQQEGWVEKSSSLDLLRAKHDVSKRRWSKFLYGLCRKLVVEAIIFKEQYFQRLCLAAENSCFFVRVTCSRITRRSYFVLDEFSLDVFGWHLLPGREGKLVSFSCSKLSVSCWLGRSKLSKLNPFQCPVLSAPLSTVNVGPVGMPVGHSCSLSKASHRLWTEKSFLL